MTIYAMRVKDDQKVVDKVHSSLRSGEGRFGWSYERTADLRELRERIKRSGWDSLNGDEKECYQDFLLRLQGGDYVVYINVPQWGQCTLAKVTGGYEWRYEDDDFNHRFPVDRQSVRKFDRNSDIVPAALCARLKLQHRWWTIYAEPEFDSLLQSLRRGGQANPRSPETNLKELSQGIRPVFSKIAETIQHTHPGKTLEPFVEEVFNRVPGVKSVKRKEGRADHGADLVVEFEFVPIPGLVQTQTLVVQIKSYTDTHVDTGAVDDIRRAFKYYDEHGQRTDMGLIVSTAESSGEALEQELEKLQKESKKPVSLLIGADLAGFVLKYGGGSVELIPQHGFHGKSLLYAASHAPAQVPTAGTPVTETPAAK